MSTWPPRFQPTGFQLQPTTPDQLFASAQASYQARQMIAAEDLCRRALQMDPGHVASKALYGMISGQTGHLDQGIRLLREVITVDRTSWGSANALAIMLRQTGQLDEAIEVRKLAIELRPEDPEGYNELAHCYMSKGEFEPAVEALEIASRSAPRNILFLYNLATALGKLFRNAEAEKVFRQALSIDPNDARSLAGLGELLTRLGRRAEAVACYHRAHETHPPSAESNLYVARQLIEAEEIPEAIELLKAAARMEPDSVRVQVAVGEFFTKIGRFEDATKHLRRAIEMDPDTIEAYTFYFDGKKVTAEDQPMIDRLLVLAERESLSEHAKLQVQFSLGKAFNDLKNYQKAVQHFDLGATIGESELRQQHGPFDRRAYSTFFDNLIEAFDERFFAEQRGLGSESEMPIFIVGMIRSGTTLTEQILSSHSAVGAGGELSFWLPAAREVLVDRKPMPGPGKRSEWIDGFLDLLGQLSPDTKRVTDKNPGNYTALGVIHACFPNARIIHCKRHPIDNCLSIYMTRNATPFAYDRSNIVFTYQEYLRLMDHWRKVLPSDRFIEIQYEEMVTDREAQTRRLIDFCGLEWDEACLSHEKNDRVISTPSLWQARQPIYTTSVERWRNYEPWLGEFRELLDEGL